MELGGSAASLLHMTASAPTTSPRRVSVPVLVRDGKPCHVEPDQQQTSQQTTYCTVVPSSRDYYLVSSAAGYGEGPLTAFGATTYGMPSAGDAVAYYPYSNTVPHHSHSSNAAFHQTSTSSVNCLINLPGTTGSTTTQPTSATVLNSFNCTAAGLSIDQRAIATAAKCYAQSRWW